MRADFVGSFLRPESVKKARLDFAKGIISADNLKAIEDQAIRELVAKQKELGFKVITDGEFRRQAWHLDFMWGFDGVGHAPTKTGLPFHGEQAMIDDTFLTGKISLGDHHPFIDHFKFVNSLAGDGMEAKLTIPAPAQFLAQMVMPFALDNTRKFYADNEALILDLASAYRKFIKMIYAAGCRRLQFDDCTWGMLVDPMAVHMWGTDEAGLKAVQEMNLRINNMAIEDKPADMFINTHVCRGNYHSTYANSGAYDKVAEVLFENENVNAYYLFLRVLPVGDKNTVSGGQKSKGAALHCCRTHRVLTIEVWHQTSGCDGTNKLRDALLVPAGIEMKACHRKCVTLFC